MPQTPYSRGAHGTAGRSAALCCKQGVVSGVGSTVQGHPCTEAGQQASTWGCASTTWRQLKASLLVLHRLPSVRAHSIS
ncbi:hypothetical protein CLOM_g18830 [Closterium sp. NIES-68]|nr:hypothetical protein CLOM_g18830 [Closterium sp. NIES-68]